MNVARDPSEAELRALSWLITNGGHAAPDRYGRMVAINGETNKQMPATWLRLACAGWIARSPSPGHLGITPEGLEAART